MKKVMSYLAVMMIAVMGFAPFATAKSIGTVYGDALVIGDIASPVASISAAGALAVTGFTNTGAITNTGNLTITGNQTLTGNQSISGSKAEVPNTAYSAVQVSTSFSPVGMAFAVINGTGAVILSSTPHIATTTAISGQSITLMGGSNSVTFSDNGTVSGSLLELGDTTRLLGAGDILKLRYYSGKWYEEAFVNN